MVKYFNDNQLELIIDAVSLAEEKKFQIVELDKLSLYSFGQHTCWPDMNVYCKFSTLLNVNANQKLYSKHYSSLLQDSYKQDQIDFNACLLFHSSRTLPWVIPILNLPVPKAMKNKKVLLRERKRHTTHRPPRSKYMPCCSSWGYPSPVLTWDLDEGVPHPSDRMTSDPILTWDGVPPHPDLGRGYPHPDLGRGYSPPNLRRRNPPILTWEWVPPCPDLGWVPPSWPGKGYPPNGDQMGVPPMPP